VAFHRYMSGIRKDGSNITDSRRGCVAADYNIWTTQFMSDFLFQWDRIAEPLWGKIFHETVTPNKAVEYSLSLIGNFEDINKHTVRDQWRGCGEDEKNMTQQATTLYGESWYPRISFAPYFANKGELVEILLNNDRLVESNYTAQSGANYEISLLARNPALHSDIKAKISEPLLAKIVGNVPKAIRNLGITQNIKGELITLDASSISIGTPELRDYRPWNKSGKSERFKVEFQDLQSADLSLNWQTISFSRWPGELIVGFWMEDLFQDDRKLEVDWQPIYDKCGQIIEDNEFYLLEIPIKSNWEELNDQFECIAENSKSPKIEQLIGLLVHAAEKIDLEALRP